MSKVYVLSPINWDYNDEYHTSEGYEEPQGAFATAEAAEAARWKAETDMLRGLNIMEFSYDGLDSLTDYSGISEAEINARLKAAGLDPLDTDGWEYELPGDLTEAQAKVVLAVFPGVAQYALNLVELEAA